MKKTIVRVIMCVFFLVCVLLPLGNTAEKPIQVVVMRSQDIESYNLAIQGIKDFLASSLTESYNISILDYHNSDVKNVQTIREVKTIVPDVIFTLGYAATVFTKKNFTTAKIVYGFIQRPERYVFFQEKDIIGVALDIPLIQQLQLLLEILPETKRIGVVFDPLYNYTQVIALQKLVIAYGMSLVLEPVQNHKSVPEVVRHILPQIDVLWLLSDPTVITKQSLEYIVMRTMWAGCAVFADSLFLVNSGALCSATIDEKDIGKQMAELGVQVLSGKSISSIFLQHPREIRVVLNLKTARKLNVRVTKNLLNKTSRIVK